ADGGGGIRGQPQPLLVARPGRARCRGLWRDGRCRPYPAQTLTALPDYTIRRSDRARRLRIVVAPEGVEVVLPRRMALREAEEFVAEKRPWIERTLRAYRAAEAELPTVELRTGGEVPYLGFRLSLRVDIEPWRTRSGVSR